eukprot:11205736-Lingulodinium_polyedra.AAC.1
MEPAFSRVENARVLLGSCLGTAWALLARCLRAACELLECVLLGSCLDAAWMLLGSAVWELPGNCLGTARKLL